MLRNIIIEGPDGAGKTSLAETLTRRYPATRNCHHGAMPHLEDVAPIYHQALVSNWPGLTIIDRAWPSERIYGRVYRGGSNRVGDAYRRMLERVALSLGTLEIVCLPPLETCLQSFRERLGTEYLDNEAQLRAVYQEYHDYAHRPTSIPRLIYDYTANHALFILLNQISDHCVQMYSNAGPGAGNYQAGRVLMVGERFNSGVGGTMTPDARFPFVSYTRIGCSGWLAEQLEGARIPESFLYWINAIDDKNQGWVGSGAWLRALAPRAIVALGGEALQWVKGTGFQCQIIESRHPQYWHRFRTGQAYPMIKELCDAYNQ